MLLGRLRGARLVCHDTPPPRPVSVEDVLQEARSNPLEVALESAQALLAEKEAVREALEAEAQEVAQVSVGIDIK